MEIVIVRHGETEYNKTKRIQGQQQVSLNENGRTQARKVAESLKHYGFTHIYCSNLKRAKETADIINESFLLPVLTDSRLDERNWGGWENKNLDEIIKECPNLKNNVRLGIWDFTPNRAETVQNLIDRSVEFFQDIARRHHESDVILVVTHGGPMRTMLGFIKNLDPTEYMNQDINNGQMYRVEYKNSRFSFKS